MTRKSITIAQKLAVREKRQSQPSLSNLEIKDWFEKHYNQPISTSSVSDILGKRFKYLDRVTPSPTPDSSKRRRLEKWPDLEEALFLWTQRAETEITITNDILRHKAEQFWQLMPQYNTLPPPQFSNGWLYKFQKRKGIKYREQHGEASSVPEDAELQMASIREVLRGYSAENIFNCDETGLQWRRIPDKSFSTRVLPGRKRDKARITAHFCCNSTGTERLPPWFIGEAKRPRCFSAAKVNVQNLGLFWRSNKTAWMTGTLFEEWLRWFDSRMRGRRVVLLLDNFSAHESAVRAVAESHIPLQNTLVLWLPANSTSRYQPLDQGIINSWKAYWKREWIRYITAEYEAGRHPYSSMNVLIAIRWGVQVWQLDVKDSTISNCFKRGLKLPEKDNAAQAEPSAISAPVVTDNPEGDIARGIQYLHTAQYIHDAMDLSNFLHPTEELVIDSLEYVEEQILEQFLEAESEDDDEEVVEISKISQRDVLAAIQSLRLYEMQTGGDDDLILRLDKRERHIRAAGGPDLIQRDIRSFFT